MSSVTQKNPIRLFVCHVWAEDDDYHRIFEYIESTSNFFYRNTSTPDVRPTGDKEAQRESLRKQITDAEVVIVPAALYDLAVFQNDALGGLSATIDSCNYHFLKPPFNFVTVHGFKGSEV